MRFMKIRTLTTISIIFLMSLLMPVMASGQMVNHGKPDTFLETDVHLLFGGSYVTDNYRDCYREISDINNSMGSAWGVGFGVKFNFTSFVGLGTEINYLRNSGKMDMAVIAEGKSYVSNVFVKNRYRSFNIPIYMSFGFDLARNVKWNVDGGMYLDFGSSGSQRTTIYNAVINDLGQLATSINRQKTDYYNNDKAFLNSYRSFDTGLHIATGLTFMKKVTVAVRGQFGFRNVANSDGIVKPNSHNIKLFATIGYKL